MRPTKDMVREAVFSALAARGALVDAQVLDLFAGSGALGIEALSRGAAAAVFVERDRIAAGVIEANVSTLGFADLARVVRGDAGQFLAGPHPREAPFDLVFADPPYGAPDDEVAAVVGALVADGLLAPGVFVVLERPAGSEISPSARAPSHVGTHIRGYARRLPRTLLCTLTGSLRWPPPSARAHSTR